MNGKYFNNRQAPAQQRRVKNRRDADKLIHSSYTAFLLLGTMALYTTNLDLAVPDLENGLIK